MQPPRGEPERSQRISILEGSLAQVHITITGGSLVTAYALMLGAGDFQLGLVSAFTALSTMGAILGAQWVGHLGRRKPLSVICSAGGRGLWALLCLIPFLPIPLGAQLAMMLGVVFVGNSLVNLSGTGWLSWMTDLVPLERRGRYFGRRNMVLGAVAMMTSFGAGHVLDRYVAREMRAQGLAVIFGFAAATALAAGAVLTRQWEPPLLGEQSRPLIETIRRPFTNRRFARLLTFAILWAMATGISSPFFGAHMIKNLHMSFSLIAVYSILAGILNLVSLPVWGKVIDRVGNRPVLAICLLGVFCPSYGSSRRARISGRSGSMPHSRASSGRVSRSPPSTSSWPPRRRKTGLPISECRQWSSGSPRSSHRCSEAWSPTHSAEFASTPWD